VEWRRDLTDTEREGVEGVISTPGVVTQTGVEAMWGPDILVPRAPLESGHRLPEGLQLTDSCCDSGR